MSENQDIFEREEDQIAKGRQAASLLESELYVESFEVARLKLHGAWESSKESQSEQREHLYYTLLGLRAAEAHLRNLVTTGKMAAMDRDAREGETEGMRQQ